MIRDAFMVFFFIAAVGWRAVVAGEVLFLKYERVPTPEWPVHQLKFDWCGNVGEFGGPSSQGIIINSDGEVQAIPEGHGWVRQLSDEYVLASRRPMGDGLPHRVLIGDGKRVELETWLHPRVMSNGMVFFAETAGVFPARDRKRVAHPLDPSVSGAHPMVYLTRDLEFVDNIGEWLRDAGHRLPRSRGYGVVVDYLPASRTPVYTYSGSRDPYGDGVVYIGEEESAYQLQGIGRHSRYCLAVAVGGARRVTGQRFLYDTESNTIARSLSGGLFWMPGSSYMLLEENDRWLLLDDSLGVVGSLDVGWAPFMMTDHGILILKNQSAQGDDVVERYRACGLVERETGVLLEYSELDWQGVRSTGGDRLGRACSLHVRDRNGDLRSLNGMLDQGRRVPDRVFRNGNTLRWLGPNSYAMYSADGDLIRLIDVQDRLGLGDSLSGHE